MQYPYTPIPYLKFNILYMEYFYLRYFQLYMGYFYREYLKYGVFLSNTWGYFKGKLFIRAKHNAFLVECEYLF